MAIKSFVPLTCAGKDYSRVFGCLIYDTDTRYTARPMPGRKFQKNGTAIRNQWPTGFVWDAEAMKCWSCEVHRWANGRWDANEITWKNPCTTDRMNHWINETVNQWSNEAMNQWMNEPMTTWMNEMKWNEMKWMNEMNEWVNEWMKWMNEWMSEWVNEWMSEWMKWMNEWNEMK